MAFKEKAVNVFEKIKGNGRLWWYKENGEDLKMTMIDVIIALLPACIFGCVLFDFRALLVVLLSVASAVGSEFLWNLILKKQQTIGDLSALVTGILFGMCLPDSVPFWLVPLGSIFAIIIVKQLLGGWGYNLTNPTVTSVIFFSLIFPQFMTNFHSPFYSSARDIESISFVDLFFGLHPGSIGETASFLLIVGGGYLIIRRIISPIVPITFIGSVALLNWIFGGGVMVAIFGGSLMLGAFFMANDYTTCPTTKSGKLLFGLGCGVISFLISFCFKKFDGVFVAIFIMNILLAIYNRLGFAKYKDKAISKSGEFINEIFKKCMKFFKDVLSEKQKTEE